MTGILDVAAGLKNRMATISGLHPSATEPASPVAPAAWPILRRMPRPAAFGGSPTYLFGIRVTAPVGTDWNRAQTFLLPFLDIAGSKSIPAALEADETLGGIATSLEVKEDLTFGEIDVAGGKQIAAELLVEVFVA